MSTVAPAWRAASSRAHLLVSSVLAKHVPVDPVLARFAGVALAAAVVDDARAVSLAELLRSRDADGVRALGEVSLDASALGRVAVLGMAETATALGAHVAEALDASVYVHSTRDGGPLAGAVEFVESHSHAPDHRLAHVPAVLAADTVVVVDDEMTTGRTAMNLLAPLPLSASRVVLAALVDAMGATRSLPPEVDVVALEAVDFATTAPPARDPDARPPAPAERSPSRVTDIAIDGGPFPACTRHGARPADRAGLRRLAAETAAALPARPAAVLGVGEFMYLPQLVAEAAGAATCWSTTRSPICLADRDGYPVRSGIAFAAPDAPGVTGYLYNVEEIGDGPLVIVFERPEHRAAADDLLAALGREVVAVTYTRIGSFPPADVTFLLKDLSSADLERPTEEREAGMQGGAHYSETLPIEFQPSAEYQALFHELLERHAQRVATHVVALAELLVERHADTGGPVLVSLARAGTPVGVLLRRALLARHGLDAPHYSVSIIRDRGLDQVALAHVLERHPASSLQFVDGWTGKGAISRELTKVLDAHAARTGVRLDDQLAVLSDPGHCTTVFATREDALVPSACLNSTVCGLISRTVLNDRWIGPGDFHGVKCYWELAERDVSALFVDTIVERFASVDEAELAALRAEREQAEPAAFQGLDEVRAIAAEHGIENLNLVKPGVGEATRVLLRRMPMKIIVERGCDEETAHLVSLAQERGVELEWRSGMRYRAHGLIRPLT